MPARAGDCVADLFSDDAKRQRQEALRRRPRGPRIPIRQRYEAFVLASAGSVAITAGPAFAVHWIRGLIGPRDAEVLLWWPELAAFSLAGVAIGLIAALVLGVAALARGSCWPLVARPWVGLAVAGVLFPLASLGASVSIHADRAVVTGSVRHEAATLRLRDAAWVEVWCSATGGRRKRSIPTIGYAVQFPDGERLDLTEARRRNNPDAVRAWFRTVDRLDRRALSRVEHRLLVTPGIQCVRALRRELDEKDFLAARRMLGIGNAEFWRLYAEPHEAWRRDASGTDAAGAGARP